MDLINHGEVTKKIKGYINNKELVDTTYNKEKEFARLNLKFGNIFTTPGYLSDFKKLSIDNKDLYYCDTINANLQKKTSYIALCDDEKPLLLTVMVFCYFKSI